jgi:membrane protein YdbS with pleckstrin-like domain
LLAMPFPDRLLHDDEDVVIDVRPHWSRLAGPAVTLVVVIALALTVVVESLPSWLDWVAMGALAGAAGWLLLRYAGWASTNLVVTSSRLICRSGALARKRRDIPLLALTDVSVRQSIWERAIGAGDLILETAGRDGQETLVDLPRPGRIQAAIGVEVERMRSRPIPAGTGPSNEASILGQIEQLDGLRRRGLITCREFEAKKTQLLDRL